MQPTWEMSECCASTSISWTPGRQTCMVSRYAEGYVGFYNLAYFVAITHFPIYIG
jgi:hypothetical protein